MNTTWPEPPDRKPILSPEPTYYVCGACHGRGRFMPPPSLFNDGSEYCRVCYGDGRTTIEPNEAFNLGKLRNR